MAKVTFIPGIASISGRLGDVVFRRSASGKTYMSKAPCRKEHVASAQEVRHQQRFSMTCKLVTAIMADSAQRAAYEQLQKDTAGAGKMSLRKFIFQKLYASMQ